MEIQMEVMISHLASVLPLHHLLPCFHSQFDSWLLWGWQLKIVIMIMLMLVVVMMMMITSLRNSVDSSYGGREVWGRHQVTWTLGTLTEYWFRGWWGWGWSPSLSQLSTQGDEEDINQRLKWWPQLIGIGTGSDNCKICNMMYLLPQQFGLCRFELYGSIKSLEASIKSLGPVWCQISVHASHISGGEYSEKTPWHWSCRHACMLAWLAWG